MRRRKSEIIALNEAGYKKKLRNPEMSIPSIALSFRIVPLNLMVYIKKRDEELYNRIKGDK